MRHTPSIAAISNNGSTATECHGISVQLHPCNPCDPYRCSALFCTDLTDSTDILAQLSPCSSVVCFIRTRTFTECHGISVQRHPCNPLDPHSSLTGLCVIRVIRVGCFSLPQDYSQKMILATLAKLPCNFLYPASATLPVNSQKWQAYQKPATFMHSNREVSSQ